ncbi:MAG: winged helix-turn-helix domain-containing protein [Kofleriaceae bacterium]|jgi:hypothetical protein|nr:winged helix-turn-helix domain-containing protein [Kofleriaceae bacterium]MBP9171903.1 winged helix-turn-helix domain-containing protein [Kofleriaceae bacterium]MBP9859277.1 winged helix-turn-helix domain-containing protein [Kofleriaceae bacterium]
MSTLSVVEEVLRTCGAPLSVREIVQRAGARLPSKSKTPDTVVARDLAMDIKRLGDQSRFVRTAPGRYAVRELAPAVTSNGAPSNGAPNSGSTATPLAATALKQDRVAALPAKRDAVRRDVSPTSSSAG